MSSLVHRLLAFLFARTRRPDAALNERQRLLVETKFEMLGQASFGFTEDRLLHLQGEELRDWTETCTRELRRKIIAVASPLVEIILIEFRSLRCLSLQCRAFVSPGPPWK